jgi:CBS-domain-containing membrane protein
LIFLDVLVNLFVILLHLLFLFLTSVKFKFRNDLTLNTAVYSNNGLTLIYTLVSFCITVSVLFFVLGIGILVPVLIAVLGKSSVKLQLICLI